MTALVQAVYRSSISSNVALFCAAGLFVLTLRATYGLDLSAGFF